MRNVKVGNIAIKSLVISVLAPTCAFYQRHFSMSLVEASEARKARLIALRKRKAGQATDE
jgi:hypothetical protein